MNHWMAVLSLHGQSVDIPEYSTDFSCLQCGLFNAFFSRDWKFSDDQLFSCDETSATISDGVILNLRELKEKYRTLNLQQTVDALKNTDRLYFRNFIGPFTGISYHKGSNDLIAYCNQTGDAPLFYCNAEGFIAVSNDINMLLELMTLNDIQKTLCEQAAKSILTFGYMIDDSTFFNEIKRILPGEYLELDGGALSIKTYHRFVCQDDDSILFNDAVELVDKAFRKAVKRCFDKDLEYGFETHLADMSGGMDSRMTSWVARDLGYDGIVNINYCQSNSDELKCAGKAAEHLGNQFIHKQLDDISFIYDIDNIVKLNYGLAVFCGITGGKQLLQFLNPVLFGLEHTGQIGDVTIGSFYSNNIDSRCLPKTIGLRYSNCIPYNVPEPIISKYAEHELFSIYTRAFLGALSTHLTRRHFFYTSSPFLDVEFLNTVYKIPLRFRNNHRLYWAWVDQKYPEAGKVISTRQRPQQSIRIFLKKCRGRIKRYVMIILHRFRLLSSKNSSDSMNPFEYWYETKPEMRAFIQAYYNDNRHLISSYTETARDVDALFTSKRTMDKLLALTVLAVMKNYFAEDVHGEL